jgi:hypothetical protein
MTYFFLRVIRKLSHIAYLIFARLSIFASRVEDKMLRIMLGTDYSVKARNEVTVEEKIYSSLKTITPINPSLPAIQRPPKVTLMLPSLVARGFYGGVATALIFAAKLAQWRNMPLRIVQTLEPGDGKGLAAFFHDNGIALTKDDIEVLDVSGRRFNVYGYLDLHPQDIMIASAWWDAHLISKLPLLQKFIYLIQDYEPIFYPNSDDSILAENTYTRGDFIPVCNTELMYKFMVSKGYKHIEDHGMWFEPAVSRKNGSKSRKNIGKKRLFLYGRPGVARNLFHLSLQALNEAFGEDGLDTKEWELLMAGQDNIPDIRLASGIVVENLGKLSMAGYTDLLETIDVAVSPMMAPHPNYPTLEFAAIGAAVVTTKYETKQSLDNYSKNIVMSQLSPESLKDAILKAARMSYEDRMVHLETTNIAHDWDHQFEQVLEQVDRELNKDVAGKK